MHAGGKLGSALAQSPTTHFLGVNAKLEDASREIVLMSRLPAIVAAVAGVGATDLAGLVLLSSVIVCYVLWTAADYLLLAPGTWIQTTVARLFSQRRATGKR